MIAYLLASLPTPRRDAPPDVSPEEFLERCRGFVDEDRQHDLAWVLGVRAPAQGPRDEGAATAERAWRPASPKISTSRSEAPLTTLGCSVKSGVQLTKPVSLTTRFRRLKSPPQAARAWARSDSAQVRAASAPCSVLSVSPSLPLISPFGPWLICPET